MQKVKSCLVLMILAIVCCGLFLLCPLFSVNDRVVAEQTAPVQAEKDYSITYLVDGSTYLVKYYDLYEVVDKQPVPEKQGYEGVWDIIEPEVMEGESLLINAVYTAIQYSITFMSFTNEVVDVEYFSIENTTILEPMVPERFGYTGWWAEYSVYNLENQVVYPEYSKGVFRTDEFQFEKDLGLNVIECNNFVSDRGGHKDWGAVPGSVWGGFVSGGNASLTYQVDAGEGEVFNNLSFSFTCRYGNNAGIYWNSDTNEIGANAFIKVSFDNERWITVYNLNEDTSLTEDGCKPIEVYAKTGMEMPIYAPKIDLSTYISGHSKIYIKLDLTHYNTAEFNDASGRTDKGIVLQRLAFLLFRTNIEATTTKGLVMKEGASIKISDSNLGLRFTSTIPKEAYEALVSQGYKVSARTIFVPKSYVDQYGDVNFDTLYGDNAIYSLNGSDKNKIAVFEDLSKISYDSKKGYYYFYGTKYTDSENELTVEYVGRGYLLYEKGNEKYYNFALYSGSDIENNTRSMGLIAVMAYNDPDSGLTQSQRQILKNKYKFLNKYDVTNVEFINTNVVYNGQAHSIGVKGLPEGVEAIFYNNKNVNAGKYNIDVRFVIQDGYYPIASRTVVLTIEKKLLDIEFVGETFLEYTGSVQKTLSAVATNLVGNDTVSLSINYSGDMIDIASYTATCVLSDNPNYQLSYGNTKTVVITKKGSYTEFFNKSNWLNSSGTTAFSQIENTQTGIKTYGAGYCTLPFDLSLGIRIEIDLSALAEKTVEDHWFGFGIGSMPAHGSFASTANSDPGYVYIMLSKENGLYTIRLQYCDVNNQLAGLGTFTLGTDPHFVFEMEKLTDSALYTDNVDIYVNHRKIDNGVVDTKIIFSSLRDANGFSYINVNSHGATPEKRAGYINYIGPRDKEAPEVKLSRDLPVTANLGEYVILPKITVTDSDDFTYTTYLYGPDGKTLENSFNGESVLLIVKEGKYTLVVKAIDKSINQTFFYKEFTVGDSKPIEEFKKGTSSTELPDYVDELSGDWFDAFVKNTNTQDAFNQGVIKCPYYTASVTDSKGNTVDVYTYAVPYSRTTTHSFGYVNTDQDCFPLTVRVTANYPLESAFVIPEVFGIIATVKDNTVEFVVNDFDTFNVFFNGKFNTEKPFTLFVRENLNVEIPNGYKVVEFEAGVHFVSSLTITSNTVVYLHEGAYVVCLPHLDWETAYVNSHGNYVYTAMITFEGMKNVSIVGHGVFDYSLLYRHERSTINAKLSENIKVDGITMINAPSWTLVFTFCDNVHVKNVIGFGIKTNSDGIATCNSKNVLVEKSFLRSGDDLFEIKANATTTAVDTDVENVIYRDCQAWAEKTRCFGFIQETVANVRNVKFINCHSLVQNAVWKEKTGKESMGAFMILVGDTHNVSNVEFINCSSYLCAGYVVNISVEKNEWTYDSTADFGSLNDISFKNFSYYKEPEGYDVYLGGNSSSIAYDIRLFNESANIDKFKNIFFENVYRNGKLATSLNDLKIALYNVDYTLNNIQYINNR